MSGAGRAHRRTIGSRGLRLLRRLRRDDRGVMMIEFALALPIFLFMLIGIMEFAYVLSVKNSVTLAARDGARYAIVNGGESGTPADSATVADYVATRVPLGPLAVATSWPTDNMPGSVLRVSVAYDYKPLSALGLIGPLKISSTSEMVISY